MVTKARSPNYPAFGLGKAIEHIRKVHGEIHHHKAPSLVVVKAIGYTSMSGKALSAISALKKYGLLDEIGKEFKVSKDAMTILFEPKDSPAWAAAMERAAFAPDLFAKLREQYPGTAPNDELIRSYLLQNGFLITTVSQAIRAYRDTISLVGAGAGGYNDSADDSHGESDAPANEDGGNENIEIGDLVQWESGGVLRMEKPRAVRAIQDGWAFVEGSETGIPMDELVLERKAPSEQVTPPRMPLPAEKVEIGAALEVAPREKEWLRGPLSKGASYRLIVSGEVGSKEIGKLIKLLEAQKLVLDDEDEVEA
jgi:hypothetical protein